MDALLYVWAEVPMATRPTTAATEVFILSDSEGCG